MERFDGRAPRGARRWKVARAIDTHTHIEDAQTARESGRVAFPLGKKVAAEPLFAIKKEKREERQNFYMNKMRRLVGQRQGLVVLASSASVANHRTARQ